MSFYYTCHLICDIPLLNHSQSPPVSFPRSLLCFLLSSLPPSPHWHRYVCFFPKNHHWVHFIFSVSLTFCFIYFASSVYRYLLCFGDLLFFFFLPFCVWCLTFSASFVCKHTYICIYIQYIYDFSLQSSLSL